MKVVDKRNKLVLEWCQHLMRGFRCARHEFHPAAAGSWGPVPVLINQGSTLKQQSLDF
jgi:hypothetical protein